MKTFIYIICGGILIAALFWINHASSAYSVPASDPMAKSTELVELHRDKSTALRLLFSTLQKNIDWQVVLPKQNPAEIIEVFVTIGKNGQMEKLDFVDTERSFQGVIAKALKDLEEEKIVLLPKQEGQKEILYLQLTFDTVKQKISSSTVDSLEHL